MNRCSSGHELRKIIEIAEQRGPMLKDCFSRRKEELNIFNEISEALNVDLTRKVFPLPLSFSFLTSFLLLLLLLCLFVQFVGEDLLELLQKQLLPVRCYVAQLRVKQAASLLECAMTAVRDHDGKQQQRLTAARIIRQLLQCHDLLQEKIVKHNVRLKLESFFVEQLGDDTPARFALLMTEVTISHVMFLH